VRSGRRERKLYHSKRGGYTNSTKGKRDISGLGKKQRRLWGGGGIAGGRNTPSWKSQVRPNFPRVKEERKGRLGKKMVRNGSKQLKTWNKQRKGWKRDRAKKEGNQWYLWGNFISSLRMKSTPAEGRQLAWTEPQRPNKNLLQKDEGGIPYISQERVTLRKRGGGGGSLYNGRLICKSKKSQSLIKRKKAKTNNETGGEKKKNNLQKLLNTLGEPPKEEQK